MSNDLPDWYHQPAIKERLTVGDDELSILIDRPHGIVAVTANYGETEYTWLPDCGILHVISAGDGGVTTHTDRMGHLRHLHTPLLQELPPELFEPIKAMLDRHYPDQRRR